ncbi:adenylate/guanylate cyclase domain-containing protein [Pseudanabaena sp. FACHB-2040]|uniref:adenylate/guanylate cyclase domain-containing protein n=1 Tax=Pseudanabaena sp. FACHB-2040 TaxID=2692859 RepID=UPI001689F92E|nr:response regulator [Pseudanabaena sp. FACHB-2040]
MDEAFQTNLLIVDDDAISRGPLARLLTHHGFLVRELQNGEEVSAAVADVLPDLILLDILLPDTDGYEVCRRLKEQPRVREVPVIFLSSLGDSLDKVKAFEAGAADYVTKPFQPQEVLARVRNQVNLYRQRRQLSQQNALLLEEVRDRKQAEQALRAAETKYRSIFENSTAGIFKTTGNGTYISVNPALARMYGYDSPEEMMAIVTNIDGQIYAQPQRRDELTAYLKRYSKIQDAESEVYRKDGSPFWISEDIWAVCDEGGRFLYYEGIVHDISERRQMETELRQQRQQADRLLINILPYQIAQRLKVGTRTIAESFDQVSVLFADLVDFTAASSEMTPRALVKLLNEIFSIFDQLAVSHSLEKIKTLGDAYMVAGGLPTVRPDHTMAIARMALDMRDAIQHFQRPDGKPFQLRIGINTGPVVAGVIGRRKFAYDLWGDTVNIASRMEATGEPQRIQVTPGLYECLKDEFLLEKRGFVAVKGRGQMTTYWLIGRN